MLIDRFGSLDALAGPREDLQQIPGNRGPKLAAASSRPVPPRARHRRVSDKLRAAGVRTEAETVEAAGPQPLAGLAFVINGETADLEPRTGRPAFIEAHGGKVTGSVSRVADYLVAGVAGWHQRWTKRESTGVIL